MRERAKELKANASREEAAATQLAVIEALTGSDKKIATRVHQLIAEHAPQLSAKLWYGMPNWNDADGKTIVFFQPAAKFGYRYATIGFQESAKVDVGTMWPTSYALTTLTPADEARIAELVKRAAG